MCRYELDRRKVGKPCIPICICQGLILCNMAKTRYSLRTGYAPLNSRDMKSEVEPIMRCSTERAAHTRPPSQFNHSRVLLHLASIELPEKDGQKNERDQKHSNN
jgi:hypothetical protein